MSRLRLIWHPGRHSLRARRRRLRCRMRCDGCSVALFTRRYASLTYGCLCRPCYRDARLLLSGKALSRKEEERA